jgi:hypothetical protein
MEIIASAIFGRSFFTFGLSRMIGSTYQWHIVYQTGFTNAL